MDDKTRPDHDKEIARIIRKAARESAAEIQPCTAFDALAMLAPLDAEQLKLIADVFAAMRPVAKAQNDRHAIASDSARPAAGKSGGINKHKLAISIRLVLEAMVAKNRTADPYSIADFVVDFYEKWQRDGREPSPKQFAGRIKPTIKPTIAGAAPYVAQRRRKRPSNVVPFKPRAVNKTVDAQEGDPKKAS